MLECISFCILAFEFDTFGHHLEPVSVKLPASRSPGFFINLVQLTVSLPLAENRLH